MLIDKGEDTLGTVLFSHLIHTLQIPSLTVVLSLERKQKPRLAWSHLISRRLAKTSKEPRNLVLMDTEQAK